MICWIVEVCQHPHHLNCNSAYIAETEGIAYLRSKDIFRIAWNRVYQSFIIAVGCFACCLHLLDCGGLVTEDFRQGDFKDPRGNLFDQFLHIGSVKMYEGLDCCVRMHLRCGSYKDGPEVSREEALFVIKDKPLMLCGDWNFLQSCLGCLWDCCNFLVDKSLVVRLGIKLTQAWVLMPDDRNLFF